MPTEPPVWIGNKPYKSPAIAAAVRRARKLECERCAKLAEQIALEVDAEGEIWIARKIADAIRKQKSE